MRTRSESLQEQSVCVCARVYVRARVCSIGGTTEEIGLPGTVYN